MNKAISTSIILLSLLFFSGCDLKKKDNKQHQKQKKETTKNTPIPVKSTVAFAINTNKLIEVFNSLDFKNLSYFEQKWKEITPVLDTHNTGYYYSIEKETR